MNQIFVVDSDAQCAAELARTLVDGTCSVSVVSSFEEVCSLAARRRPDVVITSVRLGRFNGLHLAARFRADYPGLPMIVMGDEGELALAVDAVQLQARFVPKSTPGPELLRYIDDVIRGRKPRDLVSSRRWPRLRCDFDAIVGDDSGKVSDVGYGGLRLECHGEPAADVPREIALAAFGITLTAVCRWSARKDGQVWTCGFELDSSTTDARAWRRVVDSLQS